MFRRSFETLERREVLSAVPVGFPAPDASAKDVAYAVAPSAGTAEIAMDDVLLETLAQGDVQPYYVENAWPSKVEISGYSASVDEIVNAWPKFADDSAGAADDAALSDSLLPADATHNQIIAILIGLNDDAADPRVNHLQFRFATVFTTN